MGSILVNRMIANTIKQIRKKVHLVYSVQKNINSYYKAKVHPFHLLWVNPKDIKVGLGLKSPRRLVEVRDGDWDLEAVDLFELDPRFRSLVTHFIEGVPWKETELYHSVLQLIKIKGTHYHKSSNEDELLKYLKKVDKLYSDIKKYGYQTQRELLGNGLRGFVRRMKYPDVLEMLEINIDIGRNGELIFVDGIHRLSISYALNIKKVPVYVFIRHTRWQEYRDYVYANSKNNPEKLHHHPDLEYLINK